MSILANILKIIEIIFFIYLGINTLYMLVFAIAGVSNTKKPDFPFSRFRHITILIIAYKEDSIIESTVKSALEQDYPSEFMEIILIADSFSTETLESLRKYPIKLVVADFAMSTKAHSMQLALNHFSPNTDFVFILDADNVMEEQCLKKLNLAFNSGYKVFQCHRTAKNTNSSFALLDAISEDVNNNIFRNGHRALGLPAALIGSAIALETEIYRQFIPKLTAVGGYDKELELELLRCSINIEYLNDVYVYDEKVENSKAFYKQRRRWVSSQVHYFGQSKMSIYTSLFINVNIGWFNKIFHLLLVPKILLLGILFIMNIIHLFFPPDLLSFFWFISLILCAFSILVSVPRRFYTTKTLKAMFSIPLAFGLMFTVLFKLKNANKKFLHTEHHYQSH